MSRLYLIFILLLSFSIGSFAQKELGSIMKTAKEQYKKGDFVYALSFYQKAMAIDSNNVTVLWEYAETLRAYKDYRKAAYYYGKVYEKENTKLYPESVLYYGLMQKQNGNYTAALATFKQALRKYKAYKKDYLYLKAKREIESTTWAIANSEENHVVIDLLPNEINTPNSEFGHTIYNDILYFSSLRGDSVSANEEVYATTYKTKLYSSLLKEEKFHENELISAFSYENLNSGNGSFSLDGERYYFSICEDDNFKYQCKIAVAYIEDGQFVDIDTLGEIINEPGANTTMPHIGELDGREVLFFVTNKNKHNMMDIYFSFIKKGTHYSEPLPLTKINSIDDEITPFWDKENQRLYFSSNWHDGYGGFDVFYSEYRDQQFSAPINAGLPINSPANDNYFFIHGDSSYVSSNRIGVNYSKNPTCCSDIFVVYRPIRFVKTEKETLADLNKRLPVVLYFHNDWPDPKTTATTTRINYIDNYHDYKALLPVYRAEVAKGLDTETAEKVVENIEGFFEDYVDKGVKDLELFRNLMLEELDNGHSLELLIRGFASPLAKTEYNINLTKRRITSLKNYLYRYNNGVFKKYMDNTAENGAFIKFKEIPFGEYTADTTISDDFYDVQNSIYSKGASLERKIEIQSVTIISKDSSNVIDADMSIRHLGKVKKGEIVSTDFEITNVSDGIINFQTADFECECVRLKYSKDLLQAGEKAKITVILDTKNLTGNVVETIGLRTIESSLEEKIVVTAEIIP